MKTPISLIFPLLLLLPAITESQSKLLRATAAEQPKNVTNALSLEETTKDLNSVLNVSLSTNQSSTFHRKLSNIGKNWSTDAKIAFVVILAGITCGAALSFQGPTSSS